MGLESGVFSDGNNLIIRPMNSTNGRVVIDSSNGFYQEIQKSHNGYTGSTWYSQTFAISTTDATATTIASFTVPTGYAISIRGHILGMQDDATDAVCYTAIGCATNNAGTVAMKGTTLYQVVESNASADFTLSVSGAINPVNAKVTGIAAENWAWVARFEWMFVKTSA